MPPCFAPQTRPSARIDPASPAALTVAIALNGLLLHWISGSQPPPAPTGDAGAVLDVVWIVHAPPPLPSVAAATQLTMPARAGDRMPRSASRQAQTIPRAARDAPAPQTLSGDDDWSRAGAAVEGPPGSAAAVAPTFQRAPLQRPGPDLLAVEPSVRLVMRDRRLTGHCAHLRALLRRSDAQLAGQWTSREAVARSLEQDGCTR